MTLEAPPKERPQPKRRAKRGVRRKTSLFANGEPMIWLTGGALAVAIVMIGALLGGVLVAGMTTFWPLPVERIELKDGAAYLGQVTRSERFDDPIEGEVGRTLLRVANRDLTGLTFRWLDDSDIAGRLNPEWALVVERLVWGRFYGTPVDFLVDGNSVADTPEAIWGEFQRLHGDSRARHSELERLKDEEVGRLNRVLEKARLRLRGVEQRHGQDSPEYLREKERYQSAEREFDASFAVIGQEIAAIEVENARYGIVLRTSDGIDQSMKLAEIVRAFPANQLSTGDKLGIYLSRWWEFLSGDPRESNTEGGVYPAIVGTVTMTMIMSVLVVPFGVLAALYLREYAKQGFIISLVRIAVNNLAGVPSIVFGVFGLGFFCYIIGGGLDELFYSEALPDPTFGKRGLIWASLTLALLTLPVVIVATEEALAAVPNSMREGSYACGATKWQTIKRIVLPRAAPGIMTGMILAIARGAGEVAPLMLVGAVKFTQHLPVDLEFPFVHANRSFMHLGFHIYDLGFQSPDSEAAKPMVFTTTLLLIFIVVVLNLLAIWIRARLRGKFQAAI